MFKDFPSMSKGIGKLICALFACFALSSCGGDSSDSVKNYDNPPPANALSDIPALMDYYKVPGVSIALIKDFQIERLLVYGVRNRTTGELVTVETPFQAGSLSKSVAAVAVLRLAQDGRLFLDEDINNALTSWKLPDNSFTAIQKATARMLLNHTAGTTVHGFDGYLNTDPLPSLIQVLNGAQLRRIWRCS
jgi:CubicO group peptidase (beta-lactamase class C family)